MSGRYLLDTNIVIALFADESAVKDRLEEAEEVFVSSIVLDYICESKHVGFEMGETFLCTRCSFVLLQNVKGDDSPQLQDGIDDPEGQMEIVADQDLELVRDLYLVCPQKGVSRVPGHNGSHCPQDTFVFYQWGCYLQS